MFAPTACTSSPAAGSRTAAVEEATAFRWRSAKTSGPVATALIAPRAALSAREKCCETSAPIHPHVGPLPGRAQPVGAHWPRRHRLVRLGLWHRKVDYEAPPAPSAAVGL